MAVITKRPHSYTIVAPSASVGGSDWWHDDDPTTGIALDTPGWATGYFNDGPHDDVAAATSATVRFEYTLAGDSGNSGYILNANPPAGALPGFVGVDLATWSTYGQIPLGDHLFYEHTLTDADYAGNFTSFAEFLDRWTSANYGEYVDGPSITWPYAEDLTVWEVWIDFEVPDAVTPRVPRRRIFGRNDLSVFPNRTPQQGLRPGAWGSL